MMADVPFSYRVAFLLALMLVMGTMDVFRHGTHAVRPREYVFICVAGLLGGAVGLCNDWMTEKISPDYFIVGKGLEDGLSAGVIGGAICLFTRPKKLGFSWRQCWRLAALLFIPLALAILCRVTFPLLLRNFDPLNLSKDFSSMLTAEKIARFREVWWMHTGLYAGMIEGIAVVILKQRASLADYRER